MDFWRTIILFALLLFATGVRLEPLTGIIGGNEVPVESGKWPFMVALLTMNLKTRIFEPFCGGSVANEFHILTAAHCFKHRKPEDIIVFMGNENVLALGKKQSQFILAEKDKNINIKFVVWSGTFCCGIQNAKLYLLKNYYTQIAIYDCRVEPEPISDTTHFLPHSEHSLNGNVNNIGLIKLKWAIDFTNFSHIQKSCLPYTADESSIVDKNNCYVMGWGLNITGFKPDILHDLLLPILDDETCRKYETKKSAYIPEMMLCAGYIEGGKDACLYDSGGPLVCPHLNNHSLYVQMGIVSFGHGCALPDNPGFYTRVSSYIDWIVQTIQTGHN